MPFTRRTKATLIPQWLIAKVMIEAGRSHLIPLRLIAGACDIERWVETA